MLYMLDEVEGVVWIKVYEEHIRLGYCITVRY